MDATAARRSLAEYALADRIYVSSRYVWESFADRGVAEERLALLPLMPAERFVPAAQENDSGLFEILYVGSLSVVKGVALLIDAFRRLPGEELRLVLARRLGKPRHAPAHRARPGCRSEDRPAAGRDPLEHLRSARLYVHPSYEDGFSYSSAEALACGVPVIVSENTGMKELIEPGRTGRDRADGRSRVADRRAGGGAPRGAARWPEPAVPSPAGERPGKVARPRHLDDRDLRRPRPRRAAGAGASSRGDSLLELHWLRRRESSLAGARREVRGWLAGLSRRLAEERPEFVILHYSVFAFAYRGVPLFVPRPDGGPAPRGGARAEHRPRGRLPMVDRRPARQGLGG